MATDRVKIYPRQITGYLSDGRLGLTLDDPTARLEVEFADDPPLTGHQTVAMLSLKGDDLDLDVVLTAVNITRLADALETAPVDRGDDDSASKEPDRGSGADSEDQC